jgi:CRP/FNR family transcriptional regulator, cyclic AMP receptor protein
MPAVEDTSILTKISLFEEMGTSDLEKLNQLLHKKAFPSGTNVITVADRTELVFILLEGTVKIYVDQMDGSEVILAFLGPGDAFGEMGMVGSAGRSANVVTLERCVTLAMDRESFHRCLREMKQMSYNLVRLMARRLRLANEQIQALSTLDVRGRVARQIAAFAQQYGEAIEPVGVRIPLRLTQTDLASLVGASRERVNQVVVDFKESGFISVDPSHRISVHDLDALIARFH